MYYADWNYWKLIPTCDLHSVVKLSFGIDPRDEDQILLTKRKPCKDLKVMPEDLFNERHEIAIANQYRGLDVEANDSPKGNGFSKVSLSKFATWALHKELKIPSEMAEMAGAENMTQINSSTNSKQQAQTGEIAQLKIDKPLATKERNTLLVIIAALAKEAKIDLAKPSKAGLAIAHLTEKIGAPVDHATIEEKIKLIKNALESRAK